MTHLLLILIIPMVAAAALAPAPVAAQDIINQTVQNQSDIQRTDDTKAAAAAQAYYNYALQLRRMGYTGPLPAGVTPEFLNDVIKHEPCNCCCRYKNRDSIQSIYDAIIRGCTSVYWNGSRWICQ